MTQSIECDLCPLCGEDRNHPSQHNSHACNRTGYDHVGTSTPILPAYYTVIVPYVAPEFQTEWHPTENTGPFAILSRGAFKSEASAIAWARAHLNGTPYSLKAFVNYTEVEKDPKTIARANELIQNARA